MTLLSLNGLYKDSFRIWQCKDLRKWVSLLGENSLMYSSWINSEKKKKKQLKPFWSWHTVEYQGYLLMSQSFALVQNPPASPCSRVMFSVPSHLLFLTSFSDPLSHILDPDIDTHLPPVHCTQQIASGHSSNVFISVHLPVLPENVSNTDFSLRGKISNAE